ncbi:MAG TPA: hypothetical protein VMI11_07895, partial [Actinomycetes bacterium]|nr:hypothetical protein [Actinomycetes bacterium]
MRIRRARVTPETALRARQRMAALTPSAAPDEGPAQPVEDEEGAVAALEELRAALADHVPATVRSGRLALSRGAAMGLAAL